jgi:hypothetical protein
MLNLKVWKRKELIGWRVDDEIIRAMKSEQATEKMAALFFVGIMLRDFIFISLSAFFVLWIDMEGAVKIQEKEY